MPEFAQIERRRGLTPDEFFSQYIKANRPVVLQGIADDWKERWTPELLKEKHGDQPISCESDEIYIHDRSQKKMPLRLVIDSLLAASQEYRVRTGNFLAQVPDLQEEFQQHRHFESFLPEGRIKRAFWLSPAGNRTSLHHDSNNENLNVQVFGRKRFLLLPPGGYKRLYAHFFAESPVDPRNPDLARYPKFAGLEFCEATLSPGDTLYVPQFWWHFVETVDLSININTWVRADEASARSIVSQFPLLPQIVFRTRQNEAFEQFTVRNIKRLNALYLFLTGRGGEAAHS